MPSVPAAQIDGVQQGDPGLGAEDFIPGAADVLRGAVPLVGVDQVVRLQQDLVVRPVHVRAGMVVGEQKDHPPHRLLRQVKFRQEGQQQPLDLRLLMPAVRIAILPAAEGAGDVVEDVRVLQPPDNLRIGVNFQKMVGVMGAPP